MNFENCTIIIPVLRETESLERIVETILNTCDCDDLKEFIIVVHPEYTAKESYHSIEKVQQRCQDAGVEYEVLSQTLPGMGGAVRNGIDAAKGSHTIFLCADESNNPDIVSKFVEMQKRFPCDCISASRYIEGGTLGSEYKLPKKIWNFIANKGLHLLYPSKITDFTSGIRSVPSKVYQAMVMIETGHPWAVETTFKLLRLGVKFHEVPLVQRGGSQSGYWETLQYIWPMLYCRFMSKKKILKPGTSLNIMALANQATQEKGCELNIAG